MKNILKIYVPILFVVISACDSFDQEAFDRGLDTDQEPEYIIPTTFPKSEEQFLQLLHGTAQNTWVAREFTLEGLLGDQDCRLDDAMILRADGTYLYDGGKMSCGGEDISSKSGTYKISYVDRTITFDENTDEEVKVQVSGLDQGVIALNSEVEIFGISMDIEGVYIAE